MSDFYILDGHTPVPVADVMIWAKWFSEHEDERIVARWEHGGVRVSTVFVGLDMSFERIMDQSAPPILFETMIFGGLHDKSQWRCSTWDEAEAQHAAAVALVKKDLH